MSKPLEAGTAPRLEPRPVRPLRRVLGERNFRLLWSGQAISLLGDQFFAIALPWLVLRLTGDPLALGLVVALLGVPRALFVLLGGAITDRFSPRTVMVVSDLARLLLSALLALLVATGATQPWMLYVLAPLLGLLGGLFMPASNSIVPYIVAPADLQAGNALFQGTAQLSAFVGPTLAGTLIALGPSPLPATAAATGSEQGGMALAFALDALTFLASVATLWLMRVPAPALPPGPPAAPAGLVGGVLGAIKEGGRFVWGNPLLRAMFVVMSAINFLVAGPLAVGLPVLADTRLPERAAAFGIIMSAYGGGNLAGYVLAGVLPRFGRMGPLAIALVGAFGLGMAVLGLATTTPLAAAVLLVLGVGNGYFGILFITWLQRHTPQQFLGRIMSLMLFATLSLIPLSGAVAGAVVRWSLPGLFGGAAGLILLLTVYAAARREIRALEF